MALPKNLNQLNLSTQTAKQIKRINHDIAVQCKELRTKQGVFAKEIAVLSGGIISMEKYERIELERFKCVPLETIVALGLIFNSRVKLTFEPLSEPIEWLNQAETV